MFWGLDPYWRLKVRRSQPLLLQLGPFFLSFVSPSNLIELKHNFPKGQEFNTATVASEITVSNS